MNKVIYFKAGRGIICSHREARATRGFRGKRCAVGFSRVGSGLRADSYYIDLYREECLRSGLMMLRWKIIYALENASLLCSFHFREIYYIVVSRTKNAPCEREGEENIVRLILV